MNWLKSLLFLFIFFSNTGHAENTFFCDSRIENLPIQARGRVKPLYVHANEMIKFMTGKSSLDNLTATQIYCLLTLKGMGLNSSVDLQIPIEHVELKEFLNTQEKMLSISKLLPMTSEISMEMRKQQNDTSYKKSLQKLMQRISIYQSISSAEDWKLPKVENKIVTWLPFHSYITEGMLQTSTEKGPEAFHQIFQDVQKSYSEIKGTKHLVEFNFAKAKLPVWSLLLTLLSLASLLLFKKYKAVLTFSVLTLITQTIYMTLRVYISGRAPITNMYETVMFSGYGALLLALIISYYRKEKIFIYVGLAYNACTLLMMNFAGSMLSPSISPLVPVLRDNFWLSTHVTTIILSYGAYALSWVLANTVLFKKSFSGITKEDENYYSDLIYTSLKYASILLAAGIILGGVWADYSWGRFWGWDPKETWSLIVLCIYMAILHGRYTSWINPKVFIPLVAGAFMSVMMAWFGVNYILASGLHSYGFSEGGAIFLGSFFTIQTLVLIFTKFKQGKPLVKTSA